MKRLGALLLVGAIALTGCSKKDEGNKAGTGKATGAKAGTATVEHGSKEGKGTGAGAKSATGDKNADPKSGEHAAAGGDRGAYLVSLGGCMMCHTAVGPQGPAMDKMFAGGLEVKEEFGTWRSPNITPDPDTGIGTWTEDQVVAAIRDGVRPDGTKLHPIMPWPFYRNLTDADAKAIAGFLMTKVKPVANKVERATLPPMELPLPPPDRTDPGTDPVKRGAYLASLMHCAACHTPMTKKGPDFTKMNAGGMKFVIPKELGIGEGTIYSGNLTPDEETGIGKYTEEDIVNAVRRMQRPDGRPIVGPMMFYGPLWSQMTDEDGKALAAYFKSLKPVKNKVPVGDFKPAMGGGPPKGAPPADPKTKVPPPDPTTK